jgi:hypothetical protein
MANKKQYRSMDKKKVKELIEKTIRFTKVTDDDYI